MKATILFLGIVTILITAKAQEDQDIFNFYFAQDFEHNTLGVYQESEWAPDWNYPSWSNRQVPPEIVANEDPENGSKVMRFIYPEGCLGPAEGGGQWMTPINPHVEEIYLSYRVKFKPGFDFVYGGKLPGLKGGPEWDGFGAPGFTDGFICLLMWEHDATLIFYYYHHDQTHEYGDAKLWDTYIEPGKWMTITIRVVLNSIGPDGGYNNGIFEGFIDGKLVCQVKYLRLRNVSTIGIEEIFTATFFGGGEDFNRAAKDEWLDVDNFYLFTYKEGVDVPRGHEYFTWTDTLPLPGADNSSTIIEEPPADTIPKIEVNAYGQAVNSENAHFRVLINKEEVGDSYVSPIEQKYTFELEEPVNENDTIYIVFDNDLYIDGVGDRNLYVSSINVNNTTYSSSGSNTVFVYDLDVLYGNDIRAGSNVLSWNGKLVFFLGQTQVNFNDVYPTLTSYDILPNDPPVLEDQVFTIADSTIEGTVIGQIIATDDETQTLSYVIDDINNENFSVVESTGEIYISSTTSLAEFDTVVLTAEVTDNACNTLSSSAQVTIVIQHTNAPVILNNPPSIKDQTYNILDTLTNGSIVAVIDASDPNYTQELTYSIVSGNQNNVFSIHQTNGFLIVNNDAELIANRVFNIGIKVQDNGIGNLEDSAIVTINVDAVEIVEINYPPIIIDQEFNILEEEASSDTKLKVEAFDANEDQSLTYSILSGNDNQVFSIEPSTGYLTINKLDALNFKSTINETYILQIQVTDNGEGYLSNSANVKINILSEITTIYIDPSNVSDDLEDGSLEHPYDSWSDITWEEGKSYLQKKGTTTNEPKINIYADNVTLGAYGEGNDPVINSTATDFALRAYEKSNITIQELEIYAGEALSCIYFLGITSDNNVIQNCKLEGALYGVRIISGKTVILKYNTIKNNGDGVYSLAESTKVYYNIFSGNGIAINIKSLMSSTEVYNNVFYDNNEGVSTSYSSLTIYNNIFYLLDPTDKAINHSLDDLVSDNNIFYPEQDGFLDINNKQYNSLEEYQESLNLDIHSFTSDPMFVNVYNDNFNLEKGSPGIDAGRNVGIPMDLYGYLLPYGSKPDIGIIENIYEDMGMVSSVLDNQQDNSSLFIYPNPSDGRFKLSFEDVNFNIPEIFIMDIQGNRVYQDNTLFPGRDLFTDIDISELPRGIYIVFLTIENQMYSKRIVLTN